MSPWGSPEPSSTYRINFSMNLEQQRCCLFPGFSGVPEEGEAALTEAELEQRVDIFLRETDVLWMFDLPTALMSTEAEEAARVL